MPLSNFQVRKGPCPRSERVCAAAGTGSLPDLKIRDLTFTPLVQETIKQIRRTTKHSRIRQTARLFFLFAFLFQSFGQQFAYQDARTKSRSQYGPPKVIGTIKNESVNESSGLVASRTTPGVYWTHNDSGDGPFLYAIRTDGEYFGVWRVTGAQAIDWEDISIGPGPVRGKSYLYIGDIGYNGSARKEIVVYRVLEPKPSLADQNSS